MTPLEQELEITLMIDAATFAGRLKKYERGDYGDDKLKEHVQQIIPQIFLFLQVVCGRQGKSLLDAARFNKKKVEKRLSTGTLRGDGSNREVKVINGATVKLEIPHNFEK